MIPTTGEAPALLRERAVSEATIRLVRCITSRPGTDAATQASAAGTGAGAEEVPGEVDPIPVAGAPPFGGDGVLAVA